MQVRPAASPKAGGGRSVQLALTPSATRVAFWVQATMAQASMSDAHQPTPAQQTGSRRQSGQRVLAKAGFMLASLPCIGPEGF